MNKHNIKEIYRRIKTLDDQEQMHLYLLINKREQNQFKGYTEINPGFVLKCFHLDLLYPESKDTYDFFPEVKMVLDFVMNKKILESLSDESIPD